MRFGLIDNWLRNVQNVRNKHAALLEKFSDEETRIHHLCELNVIEQVVNVSTSTIVQDAWLRNQPLAVHSLVYSLQDGILRDLGLSAHCNKTLDAAYKTAIANVEKL